MTARLSNQYQLEQSVKLIIKLMCAEPIGTRLDIEISVCNHEWIKKCVNHHFLLK